MPVARLIPFFAGLVVAMIAAPVVRQSQGAEPPITSLTFSPEGTSILAGSQRGFTEYAWPDLNVMREVELDLGNVHAIAFAPDGRTLAIAGGAPSEEGVVELFTWPECERKQPVRGHSDSVMAVTWIDDARLITASLDNEIRIWKLSIDQPVQRLIGHSKGVTSLCFLPEAGRLVSAGLDQSLRVWDIASGELLRGLNNHTMPVHALARRPGDQGSSMVVSASDDKTVRLWQPTIGRMVRFVRLGSVPLDVTWTIDGSRVAAACDDGHVRVIDPDSASVLQELPAIEGWAYCLAVHDRDGSIAVGGGNGQLARLELNAAP